MMYLEQKDQTRSLNQAIKQLGPHIICTATFQDPHQVAVEGKLIFFSSSLLWVPN